MKIFALIAALDVVFFGGWIGVNEYHLHAGTEVRLPVEGYDPRDLLSGHYVRFRLQAERQAQALDSSGRGARVEFCLKEERGLWNVDRVRDDDCPVFLTGTVTGHRVELGVDRSYVDEQRQNEVLGFQADENTYLVARVDREGRVHVRDLVVKGRSLKGK